MGLEGRAVANADEATIVWRTDRRIDGCRGFAIRRQGREGDRAPVEDVLGTWVGFASERPRPPPGTHRPSTQWPIQRFLWNDYGAERFREVRYRVVPMLGTASALSPAPEASWSPWSDWVRAGTGQTPGLDAYFNRGIVAAQWLTRRLDVPPKEQRAKLKALVQDPASAVRQFLAGQARTALLVLLADAKAQKHRVYAALYELNDPELIPALEALGSNATLLLGSGAYGPGETDENAAVRADIRRAHTIQLDDRLVRSPHFAHNKFLVVCDADDRPLRVWTGSTNWTMTGLCTQANNALVIDHPTIASAYLAYWQRLREAGNGYPPALEAGNATAASGLVEQSHITAWFTPVAEEIDLVDARRLIRGARQGIVFLMFNPGPRGTLLNDILARRDDGLFVHGVINQDPGGKKAPLVKLVDRGKVLKADPGVILPANVTDTFGSWRAELRNYSLAMVHSKVIVIDPFGAHPVVMTGSHNLGPKASGKNDDNLVIIEHAPGLAGEYAVNVLSVYNQYKWRYNTLSRPAKTIAATKRRWQGLRDDDTWQDDFFTGPRARELDFWFGTLAAQATRRPRVTRAGKQPTRKRARTRPRRTSKPRQKRIAR